MDAVAHVRAIHTRLGPGTAAELRDVYLKTIEHVPTRDRLNELGRALGWDESRRTEEARRVRLIACPLHVFAMDGIERVAGKIPARLTCVMCDEWMPTMEACQYARGYQAAGGDPNVVIEGFTG